MLSEQAPNTARQWDLGNMLIHRSGSPSYVLSCQEPRNGDPRHTPLTQRGQEALRRPCLWLAAPGLHPTIHVPEGCPSAQQRHWAPSNLGAFRVHSKVIMPVCASQCGHRAKGLLAHGPIQCSATTAGRIRVWSPLGLYPSYAQ